MSNTNDQAKQPTTTKQQLSPTQTDVKHPCPVKYKDNLKLQDQARDIILLYIGAKLGYTPIKHIVGLKSDKLIENVVRQHMFGRQDIKWDKGELPCPNSKALDEFSAFLVIKIAKKWNTLQDPYVDKMIHNNKWYDESNLKKSKLTKCKHCGFESDKKFKFCPMCGEALR